MSGTVDSRVEDMNIAYDEAVGIDSLINKGLLTNKEASDLDPERVTELANRATDLVIKWSDNPEDTHEKVRYLAGFGENNIGRTELLIRIIVATALIKVKYGKYFDGVIFYGSRTRLGTNRPGTDQDMFLLPSSHNFTRYELPLDFDDFFENTLRQVLGALPEVHYLYPDGDNHFDPLDYPEISQGVIPLIWDSARRKIFTDDFRDQMKRSQDFTILGRMAKSRF